MRPMAATPDAPVLAADAAGAPRRTDGRGLRAALLIAASLTVMSGATISPGLPGMRAHFGGAPGADLLVRLVLTMPALFIALCAPFAGLVIERAGRLPTLVAGALLYAAAGTAGLWVDSLGALLASRALLGLSVAAVMTTATTLIGDYFAGPERARFLGVQSAFMGLGGLVFITGGGLAAEIGWRAPFAIYLAALAVPLLARAYLFEPRAPRAAPGAVPEALPAGVGTVLWSGFVTMTAFYLVPVQLPFLMVRDLDLPDPWVAGVALGLATLTSSLTSLNYARVASGWSFARVRAVAWALMAAAFAVLWAAGGLLTVLLAMVLLGVGLGLVFPALTTTMLALVPESRRGRMAGMLTASVFLGQFVSPLVSQPLSAIGLHGLYGLAALALGGLAAAVALRAARG